VLLVYKVIQVPVVKWAKQAFQVTQVPLAQREMQDPPEWWATLGPWERQDHQVRLVLPELWDLEAPLECMVGVVAQDSQVQLVRRGLPARQVALAIQVTLVLLAAVAPLAEAAQRDQLVIVEILEQLDLQGTQEILDRLDQRVILACRAQLDLQVSGVNTVRQSVCRQKAVLRLYDCVL